MTQDVNIVGIDQLPAWATENTLHEILKILRKSGNSDKKTEENLVAAVEGMSDNTKEAAEALSNISKTKSKENTGPDPDDPDPKDTKKTIAIFRSSVRGLSSDITDLSGGLFRSLTGFESSSRQLYGFNSAMKETIEKTEGFKKKLGLIAATGLVGGLSSGLGMFIKVIMDSANVILKMSEMGLREVTTAEMLTKNLSELGMTSEQFQTVMENYTTAMGTFGIDSLSKLVGRTSEINDELAKYSLTTADATEFAAEYLQQQRLSGVFDAMENKNRSKRMLDNIQQLSAFSTMLNVSRKEIAKAQTEMLEQDRIRAILVGARAGREREQLSDSIRMVTGFFAGFGKSGRAVNEMFADMVSAADPAMALENYGVAMAAAPEAMSHFMQTVRDINSGAISEQQAIERSAEFNLMLADNAQRISEMARLTGDQFTQTLASQAMAQKEFVYKMREDGRSATEIQEALRKRARMESTLGESAAGFQDALNFVRRSIERVVIGFFNAFGGAEQEKTTIENVFNLFETFGRAFGEFVDEFLEDAEGKGIGGFMMSLYSSIWEKLKEDGPELGKQIFGAALDTLGALFGFLIRGLGTVFSLIAQNFMLGLENLRRGLPKWLGGEGESLTPEQNQEVREIARRDMIPYRDALNVWRSMQSPEEVQMHNIEEITREILTEQGIDPDYNFGQTEPTDSTETTKAITDAMMAAEWSRIGEMIELQQETNALLRDGNNTMASM